MSKVNFVHFHANAFDRFGDKHIVTVVGKVEQGTEKKDVTEVVPVEVTEKNTVNGTLTFRRKQFFRKLTVGVSICNPLDNFNEAEGVRIAKSRIEKGEDVGSVKTNDVTMLTEDLVVAELLGKINYITKNIDKYLGDKIEEKDDLDFEHKAIGI